MGLELGINLGIFLKEPRAGRVKTRLARRIGDAAAVALYRAFVADTVTLALNSGARHCEIFHDGAPPSAWSPAPWPGFAPGQTGETPQSDGDLGDRLIAAFAAGPMPMLILGTDSPDLPPGHLHSALLGLESGADLVLGAVPDGGVWCIGLREPNAEIFTEIPWSSCETGDALRNRADSAGLNRVEVASWYDCDLVDDLRALSRRLRKTDRHATMTRQTLETLPPIPDLDP